PLLGPALRREGTGCVAPRRAGPHGAEDLRPGAEDAVGVRAPLDLGDPALDRAVDPPAALDDRGGRPGAGCAGVHARRSARLAVADVRADVRGTPDGSGGVGRRVPLRLLARVPSVLARVLLRALRRARISVRACRRD